MSVHIRRHHVAALALLALLVAASASLAPRAAGAARPGIKVYILEGGHRASDLAMAQTLRDRGLVVTRGVLTSDFDGSQATLADYDVLVVLYTANWNLPVPQAGLDAIRAYVEGGGSLVTGEWFGWRGQLADLMPTANCGWNTDTTTPNTYTQVAPSALINAGLPTAFSFMMGDFNGSESCLQARADATVLYSSSKGGGKGEGVGLAAWNVGLGSVTAFSTLLSATELESAEYRTLVQNTVAWAADVRDATPPRVQSVEVTGDGELVRSRAVELSVKATDRGGAGVGAFLVAEYVFSGDENDAWRLVGTSGWRRYRQPGATLGWNLSADPGVHYLRVFVADRAGNISREPGVVFVSYKAPEATPIALDELHIYRVRPGNVPLAAVRMDVAGGNPDLYVRGPSFLFNPVSDALVEATSFVPQAGVYEIGVLGYEAGSYQLDYRAGALQGLGGDGSGIDRRGRGSVINLNPPEPVGEAGDLPAPPSDVAGLTMEPMVFLPAVTQP